MSESDAAAARVEATYHKVTWRLMSFIFVCWVLNYLDRVNVSFAQLHLKQDLGLSDAAYGLGVSLFFIGYILLEVPSTLWLKKIGARLTISRIMILWGGISTAMAFMTTPAQFYIARILLGAAEAGFWPGIILYLTYWYPGARRLLPRASSAGRCRAGSCITSSTCSGTRTGNGCSFSKGCLRS
jgi:ACS family phthalate transporter-like MFS transporter